MDKTEKTILLVFLTILVILCCLLSLCGGAFLILSKMTGFTLPTEAVSSTPAVVILPTNTPKPLTATPIPTITPAKNEDDTLNALESALVPSADLVYLAERYEGKSGIPLQLSALPAVYEIGDRLDFYKMNVDTNETESVTAILRYESKEIYFWVEEGVDLDQGDLERVMAKFSERIYPTNQEFFGVEWMPGVDNDPHLYILYGKNMGFNLAGYHAPSDGVVPLAHEYSNAHEMFYLNADVLDIWDSYTLSVMAHEFQHLIHGYHDPNEELWLNEGFSELATLLNGYDAGGFDSVYAYDTDIQLNTWSVDSNENDSHYGASFLYTTYLLERFGEEITKAVVANPLDGFTSIDDVFTKYGLLDPMTGKQITADDFFMDWAITNYLNDASFDDGRYRYSIYAAAPAARTTETVTFCDGATLDRKVKQYGVDYIDLDCEGGAFELEFSASPTVSVLPLESSRGRFMWSNSADTSTTKMSQVFDFSKINAPITMSYQTWYDLEEDYDYLYLLASVDGEDWEIIKTPSCSLFDPSGNSYGCGYNGRSAGWVTEEVDLSNYAGKVVELSFEYVTDAAVTGEGMVIDDMAIPAIGYSTDFNEDDGGWRAEGFVRIDNIIPQTFMVSIIESSGQNEVQKYHIASGEKLTISLNNLPQGDQYTIVVSGSSRFTRQDAAYRITLKQE